MAISIKNYKVKGIVIPVVYLRLLSATVNKDSVSGNFLVYVSKEVGDLQLENNIDHFGFACDNDYTTHPWELLYTEIKKIEPFASYEMADV